MATISTKTYTLPVVTGHRLTCVGHQYTVVTPDFTDVVTANSVRITCTCNQAGCEHIQAVTRYYARLDEQDARRRAYEATFDLSYGASAY